MDSNQSWMLSLLLLKNQQEREFLDEYLPEKTVVQIIKDILTIDETSIQFEKKPGEEIYVNSVLSTQSHFYIKFSNKAFVSITIPHCNDLYIILYIQGDNKLNTLISTIIDTFELKIPQTDQYNDKLRVM